MEVATIQLFGPFSIVRSAASDTAHRAVEEELQQKLREMEAKAKEEEKFQVGFFWLGVWLGCLGWIGAGSGWVVLGARVVVVESRFSTGKCWPQFGMTWGIQSGSLSQCSRCTWNLGLNLFSGFKMGWPGELYRTSMHISIHLLYSILCPNKKASLDLKLIILKHENGTTWQVSWENFYLKSAVQVCFARIKLD